ncbi:MAG: 1,4-dihydroxy-2-naphthoate octaprenyltransferase [Elusimicrobia bacterium GWA2_56_46]|nr:MAG: 1,4-dihydroxy-2-naphthoate octaprenyltransferase [Elusimicrobia bacterium GWA2_56_46]OGR54841.1 MAG: 1,4-dihydroxy-2-naphthoate octaprenyltransferase [Elusimicrobia bacterium GWC2_56_31]HBB67108.1 1,4-dihydroxy-2-naphthoate octaprenyltransferase [Elusimicrobiota bacterium]HBW23367.1 1,4-dihydroxy-2-naphthoate octaprenyltransferase [Elusimicrobiota bacterium]
MKRTLVILRAYSWPASAVPVVLGTVIAYNAGAFSPAALALTLLAALAVHSGANLANTYFDFRNGIDRPDFSDDRALVDGLITPPAALKLSLALFGAAAAIGVYFAFSLRLPLLLGLGAAGFLLAWFYTAGKISYKYKALGDFGVFLAFGPLIVAGTALIQTGRFLPEALWASAPVGLLIAAILHANNMRDLDSDLGSGIKTLAGTLGRKKSKNFYRALLYAPYAFALFGGLWPAVFTAVSLPSALKLDAMCARENFPPLVGETAKFVAVFGLLFSAGLWI